MGDTTSDAKRAYEVTVATDASASPLFLPFSRTLPAGSSGFRSALSSLLAAACGACEPGGSLGVTSSPCGALASFDSSNLDNGTRTSPRVPGAGRNDLSCISMIAVRS